MGDFVYTFAAVFPATGGSSSRVAAQNQFIADVGDDDLLDANDAFTFEGVTLNYIGQTSIGGLVSPVFQELGSSNVAAFLPGFPSGNADYAGITSTDPFDFSASAVETFSYDKVVGYILASSTFGPELNIPAGFLSDGDGSLAQSDATALNTPGLTAPATYAGVTNVDGVAYPIVDLPGAGPIVLLDASVDASALSGAPAPFSASDFNFDGSTVPPAAPLIFEAAFGIQLDTSGATPVYQATTPISPALQLTQPDNTFDVGDTQTVNGALFEYLGFVTVGGQTGVFGTLNTATVVLFENDPGDLSGMEAVISESATPVCFAEGTGIATPSGEVAVEALEISDLVLTADGRAVPFVWIGRQTVLSIFAGEWARLVRIRAGALGNHSDLYVTGDHGMVVSPSHSAALGRLADPCIVNASALVNGGSIDWVPLSETPDRQTVYHVETEAHDIILANGAPSETYLDMPSRAAFDNFQEYLDLYGEERPVTCSDLIRISAARLLASRNGGPHEACNMSADPRASKSESAVAHA